MAALVRAGWTADVSGTEIELKFQLPAEHRAALARALGTRTAERVPLRALYFDTADGRLAAACLALRLRREGRHWVQTLKGRGDGLMQRLEHEVRLPAAGAAPPELDLSLHAGTPAGEMLARALGGGLAPVPLYGTDIRRLRRVLRHAGARIEVALDEGHVTSGEHRSAVCEVEFELLAGPPEALLDLAARWVDRYQLALDVRTKSERGQWLAAGLALPPVARADEPALPPDVPLAQARAAMVAAALAHALPNAAAITAAARPSDAGAAGYGPDHVHQLRVALRRLRTVLRAFGPPDAERDAALTALFGALGHARDADVMAQTLAGAGAAAAAAGLPAPAAPPRADDAALVARLRQPETTRLWLALVSLSLPPVPAAEPAPWGGAAAERAARWRRSSRRLARDWPGLDDAARHRLRKRLKRLRYLLEFSAALWPAKALAAELAALKPLQEALGHWHDVIVARERLAGQVALDPATAFAAGWLAREAQVADAACAKAAKRWRKLKPLAARAPRRRRKPPPP